jgi:hypothetical protein
MATISTAGTPARAFRPEPRWRAVAAGSTPAHTAAGVVPDGRQTYHEHGANGQISLIR